MPAPPTKPAAKLSSMLPYRFGMTNNITVTAVTRHYVNAGTHNVELLWIRDHLHAGVVDDHLLKLYLGVELGHLNFQGPGG